MKHLFRQALARQNQTQNITGKTNLHRVHHLVLYSGVIVLILLMSFISNNAFTVKGKVLNYETGAPVRAASVGVKGTSIMVITDANGNFEIRLGNEKGSLEISAPGYKTLERKVKASDPLIIIHLHPAANKSEEVVVVGYGTEHKSIAADQMAPLQGRVAGVAVANAQTFSMIPHSGKPRKMHEPAPLNREGYDAINENGFRTVRDHALSTFSIDVDAASYSNVRRMLNMGQLPPAGAVRIEEMINYFKYGYKAPDNGNPFSINTEVSACPWNTKHQLALVGLQGKIIPTDDLPASNLVFLVDVSGSMSYPNKLPLVKQSLKLLVDQLRNRDHVALVVYAGNAGVVLPSTSGDEKMKIKDAIDRLEAGGSTAGGAGIQLAYNIARNQFIKGGNNRIVLCSDGDFNVGASSDAALEAMIEKERRSGVYLTILGYGMGNYQDAKMQKLATKGNGNHAYIDNLDEARKVLVKEFGGTMFAIAKDVKLQVEFNPELVQAYRLIGYENRMLNNEDFNDDKKDAGELGSGHTVTALYEIIPVGVKSDFIKTVDPLKYQQKTASKHINNGKELMTIKFRYKQPDGDISKLIEHPVIPASSPLTENFKFAAAVAEFGMLLRDSEYKQDASFENVIQMAATARGSDDEGYRAEFLRLVKNAQQIKKGLSAR